MARARAAARQVLWQAKLIDPKFGTEDAQVFFRSRATAELRQAFFTHMHNDHTEGFADLIHLRWMFQGWRAIPPLV